MSDITLVTGGVRSGKSRFAEKLALGHGPPFCYLATARALDNEMKERIARHRERRGELWQTIEEPLLLPQTLAATDGTFSCILVDCLTLWLSNLLLSYEEADNDAPEMVMGAVHRLKSTLHNISTPVVLVTNEVGMGIVPESRLGRVFRDLAGEANQMIAASSDSVYTTICGIPLKLK